MAGKDKLTGIGVKEAKLPAGKKQVKLSDGGGLHLLINETGKYWRLSYRFGGKQKTMALGVYPAVSLKDAREKRDAAKRLLDNGIDPTQAKQQEKREQQARDRAVTFKGIADEWVRKNAPKWSADYLTRLRTHLDKSILPWIGSIPIDEVRATDVLNVLRKTEARGAIETAHKLRSICGQVLRYAVANALIESDPSRDLRGALAPVVTKHRATITEPKRVGELLRAIGGFHGTYVVHAAMKMTPYVFVRPGELRKAEWTEIDLDAAEWRIPAEKMKMGVMHIVPLASQVVEILRDLKEFTGSGRYVFPSIRSAHRPMSDGAVNVALRRLGYEKDEICAHGFRGMASTILHEQGWSTDVIERQLAHQEGNEVKRSYNHARHLAERRKMMQAWADYLDALRDGAQVIPIHKQAG